MDGDVGLYGKMEYDIGDVDQLNLGVHISRDTEKFHQLFECGIDACDWIERWVDGIICCLLPVKEIVRHDMDVLLLEMHQEIGNCNCDAVGVPVMNVGR